jgi:hypothetical protein
MSNTRERLRDVPDEIRQRAANNARDAAYLFRHYISVMDADKAKREAAIADAEANELLARILEAGR